MLSLHNLYVLKKVLSSWPLLKTFARRMWMFCTFGAGQTFRSSVQFVFSATDLTLL